MNLADFIRRAKLYALTSQQAHFVVEHRRLLVTLNQPLEV